MQDDRATGKNEVQVKEATAPSTALEVQEHHEVEGDQSVTKHGAPDSSSPDKSDEGVRPPLPPRPTNLTPLRDNKSQGGGLKTGKNASPRPNLQSIATTAVSRTDIQTHSFQDGSQENFAATAEPTPAKSSLFPYGSFRKSRNVSGTHTTDTTSVKSFAPTVSRGTENESLLGDVFGVSQGLPTWQLLDADYTHPERPDEIHELEEREISVDFYQEFDAVGSLEDGTQSEETPTKVWKEKRKHFIILSSAGKPIYSRHGDDNLISSSVGIILTIISFYEDSKDRLTGWTAGGTRFVIMSQGPLHLVAISKLGESDAQLRSQLEALYMQVLSTLTLPTLTHLFANRPSTDLRRPLKGTEVLLSALADSFTRGSSSAMLSALECLKMKKRQRNVINETLLRHRSPNLLYGLIVAGGRLVSVARPRKHSLHPSDLQLIFNMLYEADGIKEGGGESWIPICLPGFNKNGYLYMYVSFVSSSTETAGNATDLPTDSRDMIVVILISADKESFYELRDMRDLIVDELEKNRSMDIIRATLREGRPSTTDIIPGTVLRHFLYKSKNNVQFVMPSYEPEYGTLLSRRRLISLYHTLHANMHAKNAHLKVQHSISVKSVSLAWITPLFELYCVAGPNVSRSALAQGANKVVQWVRREDENVFIIGGAIF